MCAAAVIMSTSPGCLPRRGHFLLSLCSINQENDLQSSLNPYSRSSSLCPTPPRDPVALLQTVCRLWLLVLMATPQSPPQGLACPNRLLLSTGILKVPLEQAVQPNCLAQNSPGLTCYSGVRKHGLWRGRSRWLPSGGLPDIPLLPQKMPWTRANNSARHCSSHGKHTREAGQV